MDKALIFYAIGICGGWCWGRCSGHKAEIRLLETMKAMLVAARSVSQEAAIAAGAAFLDMQPKKAPRFWQRWQIFRH